MIGDRAPGRSEGQQPASDDESAQQVFPSQLDASVVISATVTVAGVIDLAGRLSPGDVQALVSHIIRNILTDEQQRKLAKGLNAMVAREYVAIGRTTSVPETATPEGTKALLEESTTEEERDVYFTIPESFRRSQPGEKEG